MVPIKPATITRLELQDPVNGVKAWEVVKEAMANAFRNSWYWKDANIVFHYTSNILLR